MKHSTLMKAGKILFAVPFLVFGFLHLINATKMAAYVPAWLPGGIFWVYITGLAFIFASYAILSGKKMKIASEYLGYMLFIFVLTIHLPSIIKDGMASMSLGALLKDTALAGGAWVIASLSKE